MSLMNKKLETVEFDDFLEAVKAQVNVRTDKQRIVDSFAEGKYEENLISICEAVYNESTYKKGTLRGGVNGVIRRLTQSAYDANSAERLSERIKKGEVITKRGVILGCLDREIQRNDGSGSFMKAFCPLIEEDGKITEVTYITKIGGERRGKATPYLYVADYYVDEDSYFNARLGIELPDNKIVNYDNVAEKEVDIMKIIDTAKKAGLCHDAKSLVEGLNNGSIKNYSWLWFEGIVNNIRPTPVFSNGVKTDELRFLMIPTRTEQYCYTFQTKSRGVKLPTPQWNYDENGNKTDPVVDPETGEQLIEDNKYYPTVRLNPVQIVQTYVDWGNINDWVLDLLDGEAISPEIQIQSLADQVLGRKFYALTKLGKVSKSIVEVRGDGVPEGTLETIYFINLNAVAFVLTDETVGWESLDEEDKKVETKAEKVDDSDSKEPEIKPEPKKAPVKKAPVKKADWRKKLEMDVEAYLEVLPDATFDDMKGDNLFIDYSHIPDAALKKAVEQIKGG